MNPRSASDTNRPRLKDRLRHAMIESILTAAEQVLSERLHAGRMNDIARRAGVAVGTLYNHFADRDALVAALIEWRWRELLDRLDHIIDAEALPFPERLRQFFAAALTFLAQDRPLYSVYLQSETAKTTAPLLPELCARLDRLVKRGVKEKALRAGGVELFPALLLGTLSAILIRLLLVGEKAPSTDPQELTRFFLEGAGA